MVEPSMHGALRSRSEMSNSVTYFVANSSMFSRMIFSTSFPIPKRLSLTVKGSIGIMSLIRHSLEYVYPPKSGEDGQHAEKIDDTSLDIEDG